jgi:hypothetical protein
MTKIYTAMGNAKDGGMYMYMFTDKKEAETFVNTIRLQNFPKHNAFDIKWLLVEQGVSESAESAFNDMTEWAKQIHLRTN